LIIARFLQEGTPLSGAADLGAVAGFAFGVEVAAGGVVDDGGSNSRVTVPIWRPKDRQQCLK